MLARASLAVLLLAYAPFARAFPPCPIQPLDLESVDDASTQSTGIPPWFQAQYALVGDPAILDQIRPFVRGLKNGKCRNYDALPVPASHHDAGVVALGGSYAPISGFGVVALPDLRALTKGIQLRHTLDFVVDNASLVSAGDWIEIAELRFRSSAGPAGSGAGETTAAYRIRKHYSDESKNVLEVIQAEGSAADASFVDPRANVIARFEMPFDKPGTRITLRLSQYKPPTPTNDIIIDPIIGDPMLSHGGGSSEAPSEVDGGAQTASNASIIIEPVSTHDAQLEVLDADGVVVARAWLSGQWPSELSMGLLNYNVPAAGGYSSEHRVWLQDMSLKAEEL